MLKKILHTIGLVFLALFLQVTLGDWISIQDIRPDFLLIAVILIARSDGKLYGEIWGFIIGLISNSIGVSLLFGLSALVKTITGFISGFFKGSKRSMSLFNYYFIVITIMLIHFIILYTIYYNSADMSLQYIVMRYVIPSTFYTAAFFIIIDNILPQNE